MDGSCLFVSRLYFRALRRQCVSCKAAATTLSWACPKPLFHNGQNHPRILCALASSHSEEATFKGVRESTPRPRRQSVDMKEIDALAAASGSAKASALGRKYSRCVNGALLVTALCFDRGPVSNKRRISAFPCGSQQTTPCTLHNRSRRLAVEFKQASIQFFCLATASVFSACRCAFIPVPSNLSRSTHNNPVIYADLARSGDHTEAWRTFVKLRSHGASISYSAHHQLMLACLKVLPHCLPFARCAMEIQNTYIAPCAANGYILCCFLPLIRTGSMVVIHTRMVTVCLR